MFCLTPVARNDICIITDKKEKFIELKRCKMSFLKGFFMNMVFYRILLLASNDI